MSTIAVIDYGMGNLLSVAKALDHVAERNEVIVTNDVAAIERADKIVLPGVGALADCMKELGQRELVEVIKVQLQQKPFLGICLGMQALMSSSEENNGTPAMAVYPGEVKLFDYQRTDPETGERLRVPHMGWNQVKQTQQHVLWKGIPDSSYFYFVHSYYVDSEDRSLNAGTCQYGDVFSAALARENVFAVQFHPEKSQDMGLRLLKNFVAWDGESNK